MMNRLKYSIVFFLLLVLGGTLHSQTQNGGDRIKRLLSLFGQTAYSYFLCANRPGYGVDAYFNEKGKASVSTGVSFNAETFEIPVSFSYGISNKFEISGGLSPYTQSYNFAGNKIGGFGDAYVGMKYRVQQSEYFQHAVQMIVKLPTASRETELGTGRVDIHFGAAESFSYRQFGYDLSMEINLLKKRDPPEKKYSVIINAAIDSLNMKYDYAYEPELILSGGPSLSIGKRVSVYSGLSFSRNMRLNYNSTQVYSGFGVSLSKKVNIGLGGSYGLGEGSGWMLYTSFYFSF